MRQGVFGLLISMGPLVCAAGSISRAYSSGFEGVTWGDSLAELVEKHPGGDHMFAYRAGQRDYEVSEETTLFGISRKHMRIQYFFDETGSVDAVSVAFPYDQHTKLLGALTVAFGPHQRLYSKGISNIYTWRSDDGTRISVEETQDPSFGMLRLNIYGPNSVLEKKPSPDCAKHPGDQSAKQ